MKTLEAIEAEFDQFFHNLGYQRVTEDVGENPGFPNADYVHKSDKIIVELKILDKEFFTQGGVIDRLNAIILQPTNIKEDGTGQYTFTLPDKNREGKHDSFGEPLRRVLKKANKQLKATRDFYQWAEGGMNMVLLVQVGLKSLSPIVTAQLTRELLEKEFSGIQGAIICVPYENFIDPFTLERNPECVSVTKDESSYLRKECMALADAWVRFYENSGHKLKF